MQGHVWRTGFSGNELEGVVFDDVPEALERWHASGIKVIPSLLLILVETCQDSLTLLWGKQLLPFLFSMF